MSCNGFTIKLPIEDLILNFDKKYILSSNIAKYLTIFQLNGVRYLYENYEKNKSCILNDESGLGKTVQVIGFLNVLLTSINNKSMKKQSNIYYLIICKNIDRVKHWYYHFDILINNENIKINILNEQSTETAATKNNNKTTFNKYLLNNLINITTWKYLIKNIENFTQISINYLIFDDRDDEPKLIQNNEPIKLYNYLEKLKIKYKLIILTKDITRNIKYFYEILRFIHHSDRIGKLSHDDFNKRFQINLKTDNNKTIISKRQDILNFSENIRLRRYQRQFLKELPLIESKIFQQHFRNWELENFGYCSNNEIILQNNNKCIENIEQYVSDVGTVMNNNIKNNRNNNNNNSNKSNNKNNISNSGCSSSISDNNNKYLAFEKLRLEISLKNKSEMMLQSFDDKTTNLSMSPLLFESESEDDKLRLQMQNNNINIINVNNNNVALNTQEHYNKNKQIFQVFTSVHNIAKKLNYSAIQSGMLNRTQLTKTTTIKIKTPPPLSSSASTTKLTKKRSFSEPLLQNMDNKQISTDKEIALDINDNCFNSEYMLNNEQQYLINNKKRKFKHFNNNNNDLINKLNKINSIDDVNDVDKNNNGNSDNSKEIISNSQPFLKNINNNKTNSGQNLFDTVKINKKLSNQPPSDDLQTLKYDFNLNIDISDISTSSQRKLSTNDVEILSIENNTIWISSTSNATTIDKSLKLEKSQFNVIESPELFDDDFIINFSNCNNSKNNNNQEIIENCNNAANDKSINCFEITSNNIFSNKLRIFKTEPKGSCASRPRQRVSSSSRSSLSPIKKSTTFSGLTIVNKRKINKKIMATTTTTTSKIRRQMFRKYQHRDSMSSKKKNSGDNKLIQMKKRKISDVKSSNDKNNIIVLSSSTSSSFSDN